MTLLVVLILLLPSPSPVALVLWVAHPTSAFGDQRHQGCLGL